MKQSYVVDAPAQKLFEKLTKADFWPDNQYSSRTKPMFWKDSILENLMTINGSVTGPYGASLTVNFQIQTSAGNKSRISVSASGSKDSYVSAHEFISSVGEWVNALLAERESEAGSSANDVAEPYENQSSLDLQDAVTRHRELGKGYSFPYSFDSAWKCKPDFLVDNALVSCLQVHFGRGLSQD